MKTTKYYPDELAAAYDEDQSTSDKHDDSFKGTSASGEGSATQEEEERLAAKETKAVFYLRVLVFLALFLAALIVSVTVYILTHRAEEEDFESSFEGASLKLVNSFEKIVQQKVGALTSLSVALTSYARSQNSTWPFVTMNDFQQRAASVRSLSDSLFLEILPIITEDTRAAWEKYSVENKAWLDEGRAYQNDLGYDKLWENGARRKLQDEDGSFLGDNVVDFVAGEGNTDSYIANQIWRFDETFTPVRDTTPGPHYPIWQSSPILASPRDLVNWNLLDYPGYAPYVLAAHETGDVALGGIDTDIVGDITSEAIATSFFAFILSYAAGRNVPYEGDPFSSVYIPVFDSYDVEDRTVVGVLVGVMRWATFLENVLPPNSPALIVVLENTVEGAFTYRVTAEKAEFLGKGDLHNSKYDSMEVMASFDNIEIDDNAIAFKLNQKLNRYMLHVFPSDSFEDEYVSFTPVLITISVGMVFVFTAIMFLVYDRLVERRQKLVLATAEHTNAIVTSLFPTQVRDRLLEDARTAQTNNKTKDKVTGTKTKLRSFLDGAVEQEPGENDGGDDYMYKTRPIADFFADTTVMFMDIVGFTAWSSAREPSQVFTLLETLYKAFDEIAHRRKVFKVETVGDCYVAVCGLPDPRKDHAVVMARFANDCMNRMKVLTGRLEKVLGPDTGDLKVRIGLHSGPVTAGVLRGERSRFQLFGDTMNTCARIESSGEASRIHMSKETADLILAAGKEKWVQPREYPVHLKGKGDLSTYWLAYGASDEARSDGGSTRASDEYSDLTETQIPNALSDDKIRRLVDWNTDVLKRALKDVLARRRVMGKPERNHVVSREAFHTAGQTVIDEICEVIEMPHFEACSKVSQLANSSSTIELGKEVEQQLENYVGSIAALYNDNPFHNFEHASHVTMSVAKLLSRIVAPSDRDFQDAVAAQTELHDHTYGITSDPLTQFACILSALIHDLDHSGVPNTQLVKENHPAAGFYKNKSVAEQNSIDIAWQLLMDDNFSDLRACIYTNHAELQRFRQLLVNSVMATDIMDKDLKALRNARWQKAFSGDRDAVNQPDDKVVARNRKATIVIEHLIQASDIAHTMQHWHIYRKWNERLFMELYKAYKNGRSDKNPAEFWAKGEIGFFEFYIIPLAKKLKDCGVFGVSSDEYLNYAISNKREWERKGEEVVAEMMEKVKNKEW